MTDKDGHAADIPEEPSDSGSSQASPLIRYALRGLCSCWLPEHGRWSHIYHLDGRENRNQSLPASDVFYTLNVLLGLSRIAHLALKNEYDVLGIFRRNVELVPRLHSKKYAYGMALWTAAELDLDIPDQTHSRIVSLVENRRRWNSFHAQDLGMILIGCVQQARMRGSKRWAAMAHELMEFLLRNYSCPSGLFFDAATGSRRLFSSFATHTYLSLACYLYGEWCRRKHALALANTCTRKLIELQGPQGEWPWFFYTPGGRVVDFYEVYSVHQIGMAPALLECAERHGVPGATEALVKGANWIFGENQLKRSMLWKQEGLIGRSMVRKGELYSKRRRIMRAIAGALTGGSAAPVSPSRLTLRLECRSYQLGWILWSFGRRTDFKEIQYHPQLQNGSVL